MLVLLLAVASAGCLQSGHPGSVPTGRIDDILFFARVNNTWGGAQVVHYEMRGDAVDAGSGSAWVAFDGHLTVRVYERIPANDCLPAEDRLVANSERDFGSKEFRVVEEPLMKQGRSGVERGTARNAILEGDLPAMQFLHEGEYRFEATVALDNGTTLVAHDDEWMRNGAPPIKQVMRDGSAAVGSLAVVAGGGSRDIHLTGAAKDADWSSDCAFSAAVHITIARHNWTASSDAYDQTGVDDFALSPSDFTWQFFGARYDRVLPEAAFPAQDSYLVRVEATLPDGRVLSTAGEFTLGSDR